MSTSPRNPTAALPGRPPSRSTGHVAGRPGTSSAVREKAHTREADAIAAARRRLPMVSSTAWPRSSDAHGAVPSSTCSRAGELLVYHPCDTTARRTTGSARAAP